MTPVLIDTDILIDYLRGDLLVKEKLEQLWEEDRAYISSLSVYELYAGIRVGEEEKITHLLAPMNVLSVDYKIAEFAGFRRSTYRQKGITLGDIDSMIAATAILMGMKLYTRNVKHYPEVQLF